MPGLITVLLFALATMILTVSPGPGVLCVAARSLDQGRAGFSLIFGIEFGEVVWIAAGSTGVATLLSTSIAAMSVLCYAGAAYLAWASSAGARWAAGRWRSLRRRANLRAGISHWSPPGGRRAPLPYSVASMVSGAWWDTCCFRRISEPPLPTGGPVRADAGPTR